jgi:hypothetical protein
MDAPGTILRIPQQEYSQRHLGYALQFSPACAARCQDCHSVDDRRISKI